MKLVDALGCDNIFKGIDRRKNAAYIFSYNGNMLVFYEFRV